MPKRLSRPRMCDWLAHELYNVRVTPSNPADIEGLARRGRLAEQRLRRLASIASELGSHVDADLDAAQALIREYEGHFLADTDEGKGDSEISVDALIAAAALPALPLDQDRTAQLLGLADTDEGSEQ